MTDEAGGDTDAEIASIENTMRTDNRAYRGDPGMQTRYLDLLTAREAGSKPAEPSAVAREIAEIERRIQTDNAGYRADPAAQARYLELIGEQQREAAAPTSPAAEAAEAKAPAPDVEAVSLGHASPRPTADIITELQKEPATAKLIASYGANAAESIGDAVQEATRLLNAVSPETAELMSVAYDGASDAERAKLLGELADSGRARRTR